MNTAPRNQSIELSFERLLLLIQDMQAAIARLQQPSASSGGGNQGGGGAGTYECNPGVILNPGSNTGITVSSRTSAGVNALPGTYTVFNDMTHATVVTLVIILSSNGDGTFTVVTQSC